MAAMSIEDAARVAVSLWNRDDAIVMVAIAGPESGFTLGAAGDPWRNYSDPLYQAWACGDFTSFGPWQINLRWNHPAVATLCGCNAPCDMATWLRTSWENSASAARAVFDNQGFGAWSAFNGGSYQAHLADATAAVDAALGGPVPQCPPGWTGTYPNCVPPVTTDPILGGILTCTSRRTTITYLLHIPGGLPTFLFVNNDAFGPYFSDTGLVYHPPATGTYFAQMNRFSPVGNQVVTTVASLACGVASVCPPGTHGTPPNCVPDPHPVCPPGYHGTWPNCVRDEQPVCPPGWTGTYPNCVPPVVPGPMAGDAFPLVLLGLGAGTAYYALRLNRSTKLLEQFSKIRVKTVTRKVTR